MGDIPFIVSFLTTRDGSRFAAVNHQVLSSLGGLTSLILNRQASDAAIQQEMDIMLDIDVEIANAHEALRVACALMRFHEDGCSCPICDD